MDKMFKIRWAKAY